MSISLPTSNRLTPEQIPELIFTAAEAAGHPLDRDLIFASSQIDMGNGSYTGGIVRYSARMPGGIPVFSIVAKTLLEPTRDDEPHRRWNQEAFAYADSALSGTIRGVRFPRCYMIEPIAFHQIRIFIEDLADYRRARNVGDSAVVCRGLGRFGGTAHLDRAWLRPWLTGTEVPVRPIPSFFGRFRRGMAMIVGSGEVFNEVKGDFARLYDGLAGVEAIHQLMPTTLVHGDPHAGNCLIDAKAEDVVVLDLAYVAKGLAGDDLVNFVDPITRIFRLGASFDEYVCDGVDLAASLLGGLERERLRHRR